MTNIIIEVGSKVSYSGVPMFMSAEFTVESINDDKAVITIDHWVASRTSNGYKTEKRYTVELSSLSPYEELPPLRSQPQPKEKTMTNTTVMQTSKLFRFKAEQTLDESKIATDNIEHKSAGFIAGRLVAALEKKGVLKQWNPDDMSNEYLFESNLDHRSIAMLAVQLSGLIVYIDKPMDMETIANGTFAYKQFRNIARANRFIPGVFDESFDNKDHWVSKAIRGMKLAIEAKLLDLDEDGNICRSKTYISACISRTSIAHLTQPITLDNRRKERVKHRMNPRKDGTSGQVREALEFLEAQAQIVNTELLDVILEYIRLKQEANLPLPEILRDSLHVINGCIEMRDAKELYSEYFQDLRGRMYQFAHYGPNPQSSDLARALCYHTEENIVYKKDIQYDFFMAELSSEIAGGKQELLTDKMLTRVATAPLACLTHYLDSELPVKKFFTYMVLAKDWLNFETDGFTDCRIGFGPDAKCSGAQILAILAGCEYMGAACGLTTGEKGDDPYELSTKHVNNLQKNSSDPDFRKALPLTRAEIKTPFMAIQYGGGAEVPAYSPKFILAMNRIGIPVEKRLKFCMKIVKKGIISALGIKIAKLIKGLQRGAKAVQQTTGKDFFEYRHVDGNTCTKKGEAQVRMTDSHFMINFGEDDKAVIFGAGPESKGGEQGWKVESSTMDILQRENFSYYFPVHFVQGLDSVIARAIALQVKKRGLKGFTSIHDQFRVCLRDVPLMMECVADAYREVFINNNPLMRLQEQMHGCVIKLENPLNEIPNIVTEEILCSSNAYYFE